MGATAQDNNQCKNPSLSRPLAKGKSHINLTVDKSRKKDGGENTTIGEQIGVNYSVVRAS